MPASVPANPALRCSIELPSDFRRVDFLDFHRRDSHEVAERVTHDSLIKGVFWSGHPARLSIRFRAQTAEVTLDADAAPGNKALNTSRPVEPPFDDIAGCVQRMLGLMQPVEAFERRFRLHPQLGPLIARHPGLRVPQTATPFEALSWAIIGQQISVHAAISIRRRLIKSAGVQHSSGLWCYPDAARISELSEAQLREAGLSAAKAQTLGVLSNGIAGHRPLPDRLSATGADAPMDAASAEALRNQLLQIRGIGPWTVNYALLRGYGWLDGSLHGDVAVRRSLQALLNSTEKLTPARAQDWLAAFSPWRALVAAHLWSLKVPPDNQDAGG